MKKNDTPNIGKQAYKFNDLLRLGRVCNEKCLFCFTPEIKELTTKESMEAIQIFHESGSNTIYFTGGEPTIRKDFLKLVKAAKNIGMKNIKMQTNAVMLSGEKYTKNLANSGLTFAFVSLHSHYKNISETITRVPGSFEKTLLGIRNLLKYNVTVHISHVICSLNYKNLTEFTKFIKSISPKINIEFSFVLPQGETLNNRWVVPKLSEVEPYLHEVMDFHKNNNMWFAISDCSVPLCFIQGYEEHSVEFREMINFLNKKMTGKKTLSKTGQLRYRDSWGPFYWMYNKIKDKKCKFCSLEPSCNGVWKDYAKIYGTQEVKPVTNSEFSMFGNALNEISNSIKLPEINEKLNRILDNSFAIAYLDFKLKENELLLKNGDKIISFLDRLKNQNINFRVMRPLPLCLFESNWRKIIRTYNLPTSCKDCLLFINNKNRKIEICEKVKKKVKIKYGTSRSQIYNPIKNVCKNAKHLRKCSTCFHFIRENCEGFCI